MAYPYGRWTLAPTRVRVVDRGAVFRGYTLAVARAVKQGPGETRLVSAEQTLGGIMVKWGEKQTQRVD